MIIKVVKRSRAVGGRSADDAALKRLLTYLHNEKKTPSRDKDRVLDSWFTNTDMQSREAGLREMTAVMSLNTTAKGDKWFHLIVSFPEGEIPSKEQLRDIEAAISGTLGLSTHQRFSVLHGDTDNRHLHLVISKIDPKRYRMIEPYRAYPKLQEIARELERKHGLVIGYDHTSKRRLNRKGAQVREDMESHRAVEPYLSWLVRNGGSELSSAFQSGSWERLHRIFGSLGSRIEERGRGFVVVSDPAKIQVKLSEVLKELNLRGVMRGFPAYNPKAALEREGSDHRIIRYSGLNHTSAYERTLYESYEQERERQRAMQLRMDPKPVSSLITWRQYLQREAERDDQALMVLRKLRGSAKRGKRAAVTFESTRVEVGFSVTLERRLKHRIHRNGDVTYFVGGAGSFCDHGSRVSVGDVTEESVRAAMKFARERFGEALVVRGERKFVELAVQLGREDRVGLRVVSGIPFRP